MSQDARKGALRQALDFVSRPFKAESECKAAEIPKPEASPQDQLDALGLGAYAELTSDNGTEVSLDGYFSLDELRKIVALMERLSQPGK